MFAFFFFFSAMVNLNCYHFSGCLYLFNQFMFLARKF